LGKLITISTLSLVWIRVIMAVTIIFIYLKLKKIAIKISFKTAVKLFGAGAIITIHWLCFYEAIKVSNISVTLACFSSGAFFASFLEPVFFKRKLDWIEVFCGVIAIIAISLIFTIETRYTWGIILGILAALTSSLFAIVNGLLVKDYDSRIISFYEMLAGVVLLTIYLLVTSRLNASVITLSAHDFIYLFLLSSICTAFTLIISVEVMKQISPYTVNLTLNLETVYGILLAFLIFGEDEKMTPSFYLATGIILTTVFLNAGIKYYRKENLSNPL
jgi:drug/metabolite transporter (DMT)-like permease